MWFLTFAGEPRGFAATAAGGDSHGHAHGHEDGHGHDANPAAHAHESEPIMTRPLVILAVCSVISGWALLFVIPQPFGTPALEMMLEYGEPYRAVDIQAIHHYGALAASLLIMLTGIGLGLLYYAPKGFPYFVSTRLSADRAAEQYRPIYDFLVHKWYFDDLYWAVFVRPCLALARLCRKVDQILIDGFVNGSAAVTAQLSRFEGLFDKIAVDRLVNKTAEAVYVIGDWSRSIQTGRLRNYLMFLALMLVGLFAGVFACF
jgi:NADH:ubiquinone oxidoreductase subunit 5 (subunit L)/multisubunit Na+/H+ antiporter MnhA subunit